MTPMASGDTWPEHDSHDPSYNEDSDDLGEGNNVKVVAPMTKTEQTPDALT